MKIIYVSGRYRSRTWLGKVWNIYKARRAAQRLWEGGWVVICPHMNTALFKEDGIPYIAGDCEIIKRCCDAIYMLKNWEKSEGAQIEMATAKIKGIEIIFEGDI